MMKKFIILLLIFAFLGCARRPQVVYERNDLLQGRWSFRDTINVDSGVTIEGFIFSDSLFFYGKLAQSDSSDFFKVINLDAGMWYTKQDSLFISYEQQREKYKQLMKKYSSFGSQNSDHQLSEDKQTNFEIINDTLIIKWNGSDLYLSRSSLTLLDSIKSQQ